MYLKLPLFRGIRKCKTNGIETKITRDNGQPKCPTFLYSDFLLNHFDLMNLSMCHSIFKLMFVGHDMFGIYKRLTLELYVHAYAIDLFHVT